MVPHKGGFCTGEMTFANVVLRRHQYVVYPNILDIEMIKTLRVSSEVLAACDTGNYCF